MSQVSDTRVEAIYGYFRMYPKIYGVNGKPSGPYFRWLKANIAKHLAAGTYLHKDGVFLAWHVYARSGRRYKRGWILLDKFVNSRPGTGAGKALLDTWLETYNRHTIILKCLASNEVALKVYQSRGFDVYDRDDKGFLWLKKSPVEVLRTNE